MIYTVTFNPALDYTLFLDKLNKDDISRADKEEICYGGKGINVSAILTRLGIENTALGFLAGFSGKELKGMLDDDGIINDFVFLKNGFTRINVKIKSNEEFDINAQGPRIDSDALSELFDRLSVLGKGDYLVLAGSVPNSLSNNVYEKILEFLKDRECRFVVDATGDLLLNVLKYKPFMIKPNHLELGELFSTKISNTDEVVKYAKLLQEKGAQNVLVSCGKDGAVLLDEFGNVHKSGNAEGNVISSVGCGDSMVAGFLAGYTAENDYNYALWLGSVCGNATAFSKGLATKDEIEKMKSNEIFRQNII